MEGIEGIEGVEGVEDICASLGLGHVPLLNAENRELNRRLQQLQVRVVASLLIMLIVLTFQIELQRNKQKVKEEDKQLEIYEEHIKTVKEATRLNQELVKAKKDTYTATEKLLTPKTKMNSKISL